MSYRFFALGSIGRGRTKDDISLSPSANSPTSPPPSDESDIDCREAVCACLGDDELGIGGEGKLVPLDAFTVAFSLGGNVIGGDEVTVFVVPTGLRGNRGGRVGDPFEGVIGDACNELALRGGSTGGFVCADDGIVRGGGKLAVLLVCLRVGTEGLGRSAGAALCPLIIVPGEGGCIAQLGVIDPNAVGTDAGELFTCDAGLVIAGNDSCEPFRIDGLDRGLRSLCDGEDDPRERVDASEVPRGRSC